jgi:hypothetical protein
MLVMAVTATGASAWYEFSGTISAKTWTCDQCIVEDLKNVIVSDGSGDAICAGFTDYYSGAFHFPYGWNCDEGGSPVGIVFPVTEGSAAVYDPSGSSYHYKGDAY